MKAWRQLSLGLFLIVAAGAVLLLSDWVGQGGRLGGGGDPSAALHQKVREGQKVRVALLKWASSLTLDESAQGILQGLSERGFRDGQEMELEILSAEGDMPTAANLAQRAFGGEYDLVLTISTLMLQVGANTNKDGRVVQVFGAVTDPYGAGVGISREDHLDHPAWLAGVGTFQPVRETLELARRLYPGLRCLGTVMNPSEACSQACFDLARKTCDELGIELKAVTVDNSSGVYEAASALASQGIQGFVIGGDNTVESAFASVVKAARNARIPVLGYAAMYGAQGALAGLGANYVDVGRIQAHLAADILQGKSPAQIPVENVMPLKLSLNHQALAGLRDPWGIPKEVEAQAAEVFDASGKRRLQRGSAEALPTAGWGRCWNLHLLHYVDSTPTEATQEGLLRGLAASGLREGKDYTLKVANAQGDMATLASLVDNVLAQGADLVLLTSTPTLQAVLQKVKDRPVVFGMVANPVMAGAGRSDTDHLPQVTGISSASAYAEAVQVLRECLPRAKRIGTLVNPSEVNCVYNVERLKEELTAQGMELVTVPVSTPSEISDGIRSLLSQRVDGVLQVAGNLFFSSFPPISRACLDAKVPLFGFDTATAREGGAAASVARDYEAGGEDMARVLLRVLGGENPGSIPFAPITKTRITLNEPNARRYGLTFPDALRKRADQVIR